MGVFSGSMENVLSSIGQPRSSSQFTPNSSPKARKPFWETKTRQKCFLVVLITICLIHVLVTISNVLDLVHSVQSYHEKASLSKAVEYRRQTANLMNCLQGEREETTLNLLANSYPDPLRTVRLARERNQTDEAILRPEDWTYCTSDKACDLDCPQPFRSSLYKFRKRIDDDAKNNSVKLRLILETYTRWTELLFSCLTGYNSVRRSTLYTDVFDSHLFVLRSANELGQGISLGAMFFAKGGLKRKGSKEYNEKNLLSKRYLKAAFSLSSKVKDIYNSEITRPENKKLLAVFEEKCVIVRLNAPDRIGSFRESQAWFDVCIKYKYLIDEVLKRALTIIQDEIAKESYILCSTVIYRSLMCFFSFLVATLVFLFIHVHRNLFLYSTSLFRDWELEKGRTDFILEINSVHVKSKFGVSRDEMVRYLD